MITLISKKHWSSPCLDVCHFPNAKELLGSLLLLQVMTKENVVTLPLATPDNCASQNIPLANLFVTLSFIGRFH